MNEVKEIVIGLRFTHGYNGKILQQRTLPIALDINHAIVPNGAPSEWEDVHIMMRDMSKTAL